MDFGDIDKNLARKLNDGDIGGILTCIHAINTLKVLRITGCVIVLGRGLEPLVGSVILEEIDFSIVCQHENLGVEPEPMISKGIVCSFLERIIRNPENSLRHIQLPHMWRDWHGYARIQFMGRNSRSCDSCSLVISVGRCVGGSCRTCSNRCRSCRAFFCGKCLGVNYELSHMCKLCEESDIEWSSVALVRLEENDWNWLNVIE